MSWNVIFVIVSQLIAILAIIHVVLDNRQPAKTLAWALVIWFVPVAGVVFYLFFGINTRKERYVSERSMNQLTKRSMLEFVEQQNLRLPEKQKPLIDLFINQNLALPFKDNKVDIYTDGYQFFPALLQEISKARSHIHVDMYIFADDALGTLIADALIAKAREGVEIRVIYDDVGCWNVKRQFFERMREEGIEVVAFMPVHFPSFTSKVNYRNHRKIIVIDGQVGFIGGMNFALRYVKGSNGQPWRDTMLRVTGGAVNALQRAFLVDWYFVDRTLLSDRKFYPQHASETGEQIANNCLIQVVTSGPVTPYPEIMQGFVRIITGARRYLYLETPYFLPNDPVLFALKTVALAGQSGFLHSKVMVCDDAVSTCGSTNLDFRSFENNFEANAFFYDEGVALRMKKVFLDDERQTVALTDLPERMRANFFIRLWESITRLMAPLF